MLHRFLVLKKIKYSLLYLPHYIKIFRKICEHTDDFWSKLQKLNTFFHCLIHYILGPQGSVYFADMCLAKEEHTDTGLSDTAADGVWKLLVQDGFLEWKLSSVKIGRAHV